MGIYGNTMKISGINGIHMIRIIGIDPASSSSNVEIGKSLWPITMEVSGWENHRSIWGIFPAMMTPEANHNNIEINHGGW